MTVFGIFSGRNSGFMSPGEHAGRLPEVSAPGRRRMQVLVACVGRRPIATNRWRMVLPQKPVPRGGYIGSPIALSSYCPEEESQCKCKSLFCIFFAASTVFFCFYLQTKAYWVWTPESDVHQGAQEAPERSIEAVDQDQARTDKTAAKNPQLGVGFILCNQPTLPGPMCLKWKYLSSSFAESTRVL